MKRGCSPSVKRVVPVRKRFRNRHAFYRAHRTICIIFLTMTPFTTSETRLYLPRSLPDPKRKERERERERLEAASLSHWSSDPSLRVFPAGQARPGQSLELVRTEKTLERHYYMRCQSEGWRLLPIHTSTPDARNTPTPTTNSKEKGDPEKEPNQVDFWWQRMQHLGRTSSPTSCPCK
jgi:hypothetical protein